MRITTLRAGAPLGNFPPKGHGARPATIRCRESFVLSSREQVAGVAVERQQPLLGRRMRLDGAVMQDVADGKPALGKTSRHQ